MINIDITNYADLIDVRDVIEQYEELEDLDERDEYQDADLDRLRRLLDQLRDNGGDEEWRGDWYPVTLIRDSYFTEYAQQLAEDVIDDYHNRVDSWPFNRIDWDAAARDLQQDYSTVEYAGVTYWYR